MEKKYIFRGLRTDGKGWVYGDLINTPEKKCRIIGFESFYSDGIFDYKDFNFQVIPETVGQYTGLKDKNGNEIYEGDKVALYEQTYSNRVIGYNKTDRTARIKFGWYYNDNESQGDDNVLGWILESEDREYTEEFALITSPDKKGNIESVELIGNIHEK